MSAKRPLVRASPTQVQTRAQKRIALAAMSKTAEPGRNKQHAAKAAPSSGAESKAEAKVARAAASEAAEPKIYLGHDKQVANKNVAPTWLNTAPLEEILAMSKAQPKTELPAEARTRGQPFAASAGRGLRSRGPPSPAVAAGRAANLANFLQPGLKG